MIELVISGGQTGADQGGLRAARACNIPTGGWVPKGWKTEVGPAPWLAEWGLKEHQSPDYPPRTEANVRDSDVTIWFGSGDSRGYWCTRKAVDRLGRGWMEVGTGMADVHTPRQMADWMADVGHERWNIAGNRASTSPGIEERVFRFLVRVFRILMEGR